MLRRRATGRGRTNEGVRGESSPGGVPATAGPTPTGGREGDRRKGKGREEEPGARQGVREAEKGGETGEQLHPHDTPPHGATHPARDTQPARRPTADAQPTHRPRPIPEVAVRPHPPPIPYSSFYRCGTVAAEGMSARRPRACRPLTWGSWEAGRHGAQHLTQHLTQHQDATSTATWGATGLPPDVKTHYYLKSWRAAPGNRKEPTKGKTWRSKSLAGSSAGCTEVRMHP